MTRIILRADLRLCARGADGLVRSQRRGLSSSGLATNARLNRAIGAGACSMRRAIAEERTNRRAASRTLRWRTRKSWSRRRRVVAKAEWTQGEANPRFIVTSLRRADGGEPRSSTRTSTAPAARWRTASRNASSICYADRTSAATLRANQLRLWFASMAYVLICALRRIGLVRNRSLPTPPAAPSASSS